MITVPTDDIVVMESRDTFSAWPILFNGQRDPGGLSFDRNSQLQPPFDDLWIIFRFYITESDKPNAPYQARDLHIASVLGWRLTPAGLWIRGGFVEVSEEADDIVKDLLARLKRSIKARQIGLTYSAYREPQYMDISETGHVRKLPLVAFNLYERPQDNEQEIPAGTGAQSDGTVQ